MTISRTTIRRIQTRPRRIRPMFPSMACALLMALASMTLARPVTAQELTPTKPPSDSQNRDRQRDRPLSPEREELKKRFEQRLERINALKDKGVIGETAEGNLEALDDRLPSKEDHNLIDEENKDRKRLYALIADRVDETDKDKKKVPPKVVAERNAHRKFENARPDHYLKIAEGRWIQKRDEDRANRIARLKDEGVVGETAEGYLAAVKARPPEDVKSLVEEDNRARREMCREIAKRLDKGSPEEVAGAMAKDIREHLPPGQYFKERNGDWQKRPK